MREMIRVRIWNPEKNKYEYSGCTPMMQSSFFKHSARCNTVHNMPYEYSTGLKDEHSKEIYAGDILRQEDDRFIGGHKDRIVEWGVGCYMLRDTSIPQSIQLSGGGHPWTIISNIHEEK